MPQSAPHRFLYCIAILFFVSCNKEENFTSRITFFNGVIEGKPTTLKAGNISIADSIAFNHFKANSVVPSGTFNISLTSSGGQPQNLLLTNLASNETYTALVYDSAQRATFFMRKDIFPTIPGFGRCAVRIYNLIPGSANLYLGKDTLIKPVIFGITFNNFSAGTTSPAFQEIDTIAIPKIYRGDSIVVAPVTLPFRSGKMYTLFITGSIIDSAGLPPKCIVQVHN